MEKRQRQVQQKRSPPTPIAYLGVVENHTDECQRRHEGPGGVADDAVALVRKADVASDLGGIHLVGPVQGQDQVSRHQLRHRGVKAASNGTNVARYHTDRTQESRTRACTIRKLLIEDDAAPNAEPRRPLSQPEHAPACPLPPLLRLNAAATPHSLRQNLPYSQQQPLPWRHAPARYTHASATTPREIHPRPTPIHKQNLTTP